MAMLSKAIYSFNVIPLKIHNSIFLRNKQIILKFTCNHKYPELPKQSSGKAQSRRHNQSYSNQNSMVLAQKQTYRSMKQYRSQK